MIAADSGWSHTTVEIKFGRNGRIQRAVLVLDGVKKGENEMCDLEEGRKNKIPCLE